MVSACSSWLLRTVSGSIAVPQMIFPAPFPDLLEAMDFHAVLDGEPLVIRDGIVAPFSDLQQRLGRKIVSAAMREKFPVGVRLYDISVRWRRGCADAGL